MLQILALLFFPCAVVGAFVTTAADDHDLLAFQSGGLFTHSMGMGDGLCGRSRAVAKNDVAGPARAPGYSCAKSHHLRHRRAPAVTVSVDVCRRRAQKNEISVPFRNMPEIENARSSQLLFDLIIVY